MKKIKVHVSDKSGDVSGLWSGDDGCQFTLILGHGAGADMNHPFLVQLTEALRKESIASMRYQFPYIEKARKSPGSPDEAVQTIMSVLKRTSEESQLPLLLGGKSYGGRMASLAVAKYKPESIQGLVFYGFPLHAPGRPGTERAQHLKDIPIPMLFLQGIKDKLADIVLIEKVCKDLTRATLVPFTDADHSFNRPKRSGTKEETIAQLAFSTYEWAAKYVFA